MLSILLLGLQVFIIYFFSKKRSFPKRTISKAIGTTTILFFGVLLLAHFYIDVTALRVDKWSILQAFYEELFKGNYPYFARSNIDNPVAPMPFYFLIFYPLYWIGEVGILCTLGYVVFMKILQRQNKVNASNTIIILILLLSTSLFTYWEITARSNILFNSILILIALEYYNSIEKKAISKSFVLSAILTGLVLSTRSIFIVIYATTFLPSLFRKEITFKLLFGYGLIAAITFALTFFPLLIFYWDEFWVMNPFKVQSGVVVPTTYVIGFILLGTISSLLIKKKENKYFFGGIVLFIIVTITFIFNSQGLSLKQTILIEGADISYFIFTVPFLMLYILQSGSSNKNQHQTALPTD